MDITGWVGESPSLRPFTLHTSLNCEVTKGVSLRLGTQTFPLSEIISELSFLSSSKHVDGTKKKKRHMLGSEGPGIPEACLKV